MQPTENASLRSLNSFGLDVRARYLFEIDSEESLKYYFQSPLAGIRPRLILGGGSNILFTRDFPGLVLHMNQPGMKQISETDQQAEVEAMAGQPWDKLVEWTLRQGWGGLENLSMIPGSCGAAVVQNIGAYGVELKDCLTGVEAIHLESRKLKVFSPDECRLAYRSSFFKTTKGIDWLILRIRLSLSKKGFHKPGTGYQSLSAYLSNTDKTTADPLRIRQAVMHIRRSKLPDPDILGNAGSFFKNPVVDSKKREELVNKWPEMVHYTNKDRPHPQSPSREMPGYKLAAAWLIENTGWKAYREGDAGVHPGHALVLVNYGKATGAQLYSLALRIRSSVFEKFGILLEPEVKIL